MSDKGFNTDWRVGMSGEAWDKFFDEICPIPAATRKQQFHEVFERYRKLGLPDFCQQEL